MVTFQLQLALELFVYVLLVELGVGTLKVKVLLELHRPISAHVEAAPSAVPASTASPVGGGSAS